MQRTQILPDNVHTQEKYNVQTLAMIQTTPHLAYYNSSNSNFTFL